MIFDILFVIFIGGGFWWGYQKGIIYSVFSLAAYFIGIIGALKFSYIIIKYLHNALNLGPKAIAIIAFILMFLLIVLLVRIVAWALEQVLKSFSLNMVNQLIGGVIFACISLYVLCVMIWFLNKWNVFPEQQKMSSHVYAYIANLGPTVVEYSGKVIPMCKTAFHDIDELIRNA
jgi:membrane protein required for colicin V production